MPPVKRNKGNADELHSASAQVNVSADRMNIQQTSNQAAAAAGRPREIPDSQEDPDEAALSDNDQAADLGGYDTEEDETPANSKKAIVSEAPADAKKAVYVRIVSRCFHYTATTTPFMSLLTYILIGLCLPFQCSHGAFPLRGILGRMRC